MPYLRPSHLDGAAEQEIGMHQFSKRIAGSCKIAGAVLVATAQFPLLAMFSLLTGSAIASFVAMRSRQAPAAVDIAFVLANAVCILRTFGWVI